jgi:hypothetical protein
MTWEPNVCKRRMSAIDRRCALVGSDMQYHSYCQFPQWQIASLALQAAQKHGLMSDTREHAHDHRDERIRLVKTLPSAARASTPTTILIINPIMRTIPFRDNEAARYPLAQQGDSLPLRHS